MGALLIEILQAVVAGGVTVLPSGYITDLCYDSIGRPTLYRFQQRHPRQ